MMGRLIGNRYRLLEVIGRGGHSAVYRAADLRALREVAVKVLHDAQLKDPSFAGRMEREFGALRALKGLWAPRVFDLCWDGHDVCLVMELLAGRDLDDYLSQAEARGERMSARTLVQYLGPIVETLEAAHDLGIVHRDVKPGNIFILPGDDSVGVRLLDFGLAAIGSSRPITGDGIVIGSPSYIAPEMWNGNPRALDHRVDVYSLAAVIFRALSGDVPFPASTMKAKLELSTRGERPSLHRHRPDLPRAIDDWTRQALAANPSERFSRVRGMWNALLDVLDVQAASVPLRSADVG